MKPDFLVAIDNLEQPYPELYEHLKLQSNAEVVRENLITALRCEPAKSNKAIKVFEAIQNLVELDPKNDKDAEGRLLCPISFEPIDLDKREENFYSSVSAYIFKKAWIQKWFETRLFEKNDTMNRRPFSKHELEVLRPNWEYLIILRMLENDRILAGWEERFNLRRDERRLFNRQVQKNFATYFAILGLIAYVCYEIFDQRVEAPLLVMGVGTFLALLAWITVVTEPENNQGIARPQIIRFSAAAPEVNQQNQQINEAQPLLTVQERYINNHLSI